MRPIDHRRLPALLLVGAVALTGCRSTVDGAAASTSSPPTLRLPPTTTAAPVDTLPETTTTLPADPTEADIPLGRCADLAPGSIGYRNTTGVLAEEYLRIGTSSEGRAIWAEHWGSTVGRQVLVLGQVHGDECAPAWMVQAIREEPPADFGIWLVPTINPDGLAAHTRLTALDIDPNRDGFDLATPEARAVMQITRAVEPLLTVHLHSPYRWIGAHNGALAVEVAQAMSTAAGWGPVRNAGRVENGTQAFLWEGQERVIPGHQSVLVEFPATAPGEATAVPRPADRIEAPIVDVEAAAVAMRDALYAVISARP